jgi:hypothetical protein
MTNYTTIFIKLVEFDEVKVLFEKLNTNKPVHMKLVLMH